ncbi:Rieske (2Fe-2S) protein [Nocardioides dongxiaopingii]|uniref:Rieske (2Fe-2S) protein n=1 Tax=Nocardioides dongxiaopingii TaxID=2576036 RepID=UPI0010C7681A|nr:Rieske (2Fe-2S) protein [Nocardioides dongxiaopingii]
MSSADRIRADAVVPGSVHAVGQWAVGTSDGEPFAVSRRCRHQLADLSKGTVDADGCLVCPWHRSTYDVRTGAMVTGPEGFLGLHRRIPGYAGLVLAYARRLRLRTRSVTRRGDDLVVDDHRR